MKDCVAAVGTFDGIHIGHRAILDRVLDLAAERGLDSRVVTFLNHPLSVIAPERAPRWTVSRDESEHRMLEHGIGRVSHIEFTPALAALTAREFMQLLVERYAVRALVMGHNNSFGSDRLRTREEYVAAGRDAGIDVHFVEAVHLDDGTAASSSAVRRAMAAGDLGLADRLLQRMPMVEGPVVRGKRNGHRLGFPTMNIDTEGRQPVKEGVYTALMHLPEDHPLYDENGGDVLFGVLNVGKNPTFGEGNPVTCELHVPGVNLGDMYGEYVQVSLLSYLREERRFDSIDELKKDISRSVDRLMAIVAALMADDPDAMESLHPSMQKQLLKYLRRRDGRSGRKG